MILGTPYVRACAAMAQPCVHVAAVRNFKMAKSKERFRFITKGVYPEGLDKPEKLSLRKRTKYFVVQEAQLYYIGGGEELISQQIYQQFWVIHSVAIQLMIMRFNSCPQNSMWSHTSSD